MEFTDFNKFLRIKRSSNESLTERVKLKKVYGVTVCSSSALDLASTSGVVAYPAGCTVVLYNLKKHSQSYIINSSKKAITALSYSKCERYLATGECGINPTIKIWELNTSLESSENLGGNLIGEFLGHKYAIACVAFSPNGKFLVSVGSQHDMIINVFDWKLNLKIASNKVSAKVTGMSFSSDGNYFVTVGNRHVKFWYLEGFRKSKEPIPLMGRSAILGELRNNDFCGVCCSKNEISGSTYAITKSGHLVEFNSRRLLDKWVACRSASANCISVTSHYILVGCSEAIIRIFNCVTLEYITTLPRTHYLGVDVGLGTSINHITSAPTDAKYPDTLAMVFDDSRSKAFCVYNDHSIYVWDLRDINRVGKSQSFLYHSACIWGVETLPDCDEPHIRPDNCFLTCSSDDTIRFWGLENNYRNSTFPANIYSKELLKALYIDEHLNFLKDNDNLIFGSDKNSSYDGRNGVRCVKVSPCQNHLATGDRNGNIRIYSLYNLTLIKTIEAHDSEVLCLEYTHGGIERRLLASASRDRLIHVFDMEQDYQLLQTLDDHSSSITSVKFIGKKNDIQMISCGADKSILFRHFQHNQFIRDTNCSGKTTLYDMEVDNKGKHVLTACQDRNIRIYTTQNAKHTKTFKGSMSEDGGLIKLSLDPTGIYIATSCTDKTLSIYDYYSSECMARMHGHSELVTGLKFTVDCRYLVSASGDSCIFIWEMPHEMIITMQARLSQQKGRSGKSLLAQYQIRPVSENMESSGSTANSIVNEDYYNASRMKFILDTAEKPNTKLFEIGQLPLWAKKKSYINETDFEQPSSSSNQVGSKLLPAPKPRGRWARTKFSDSSDVLSNISDSPTFNNFQNILASNFDNNDNSYMSEDSSIDSGLDAKKRAHKSKIIDKNKDLSSLDFETNNDNDGDVEDISDGERTSSDHGLYYPSYPTTVAMDFKVNEMNKEELKKTARKNKFDKKILISNSSAGGISPSVSDTNTCLSDTDDGGSTPSGENADRSLNSALGGSFENIPQRASSQFLQIAIDGPQTLSARNNESRRSISAKHKTEYKDKPKSYSNTKKEELLKVIKEAKLKLENVGYRSNLRTSQSTFDLNFCGGRDILHQKKEESDTNSSQVGDYNIRRALSLSDLCWTKGTPSKTSSSILRRKGSKTHGSANLAENSGDDDSSFDELESKMNKFHSSISKRSSLPEHKNFENKIKSLPHQDFRVTTDECLHVATILNNSAYAAAELFWKLSKNPEFKENDNNLAAVKELERSIVMAHNILKNISIKK
ncbi:mitogen-activated protein kinase-binding protein 1 [Condylostylus longicornis]|uniref:mitogen-activated protein kinase-binding protein 1 n=1 Tax=Condylostylus longicornis TaxID=2530218 RepID=UPI00244E2441|nr:mitogen-activated protein kinase-binding protein 1 [Condylostylus longicornis]